MKPQWKFFSSDKYEEAGRLMFVKEFLLFLQIKKVQRHHNNCSKETELQIKERLTDVCSFGLAKNYISFFQTERNKH